MSEPPEQRAARERTGAEDRALEARTLADHLAEPTPSDDLRHAVLERERQRALTRKAKAHGGQGELVDEIRGQWSERPQ